MKERPILFNSDMVNAVLEGRKTQTRRVIKQRPKKISLLDSAKGLWKALWRDIDMTWSAEIKCPYGKVGDQLWVRETWSRGAGNSFNEIFYRATDGECSGKQKTLHYINREKKWRPSIHMPREYSRIQLEITDIRVERLNDISEGDAKAEGITIESWERHCEQIAEVCFQRLWININGQDSWDENPWVWVIEFKPTPRGTN